MLEGIFKGFIQWFYALELEMVQYIANALLEVFSMDLNYFRRVAPVTDDILSIAVAAGWALLLGNLVFQAVRSMAAGLGFEGEDPKLLFARTFVFGFLLLVSRQICGIGLGISGQIIELLQIPDSVTLNFPDESSFAIGGSWLLVIIVSSIIMWQLVKLFFEIAERYVITALLVILAPLAFAMGGSKNTGDIFKGWCRMFGSMCMMMVLNIISLKLMLSAMGYMPTGIAILPWTLLIVGIARAAKKADGIIARIGLTPAMTGEGLGRGLPGMMAYAVVKSAGSTILKTMSHTSGGKGAPGGRRSGGPSAGKHAAPPPPPPPGGSGSGQGAPPPAGGGQTGSPNGGTSKTFSYTQKSASGRKDAGESVGASTDSSQNGPQPAGGPPPVPGSGAQAKSAASNGTRRTSVHPGAGTGGQNRPYPPRPTAVPETGAARQPQERPQSPPIPHARQDVQSAQTPPAKGAAPAPRDSRRSSAIHTTANEKAERTVSSRISTQTGTQQQAQASKPIYQNGTPKIPPPPGVGGTGRGDHGPSGTAGTYRTSASSQPPASGGVPLSDTAGTRSASGSGQPPDSGGAPLAGTAGTRRASGSGQPPVSGSAPLPGTAGMRRAPDSGQPPVSGSAPPSGMAGIHGASGSGQPSASGSAPLSGTAGMRRASGSGQPPGSGSVPPSGTAGTAAPDSLTAHGTKRSRQNTPQASMAGGAQRKTPSRREKGGKELG